MAGFSYLFCIGLFINTAMGRVPVEDSYPTIIAERPYRPAKTNWEKFFFNAVETLVDTVEGLPQTPLDLLPYPSLARFQSTEEPDASSEAPAINRDHYDVPQKIPISGSNDA
ncbi:hypothetical protein TCAL_01340 [Tigriopus californicus]|uniref:Uncharacterized protein n=1 Tax=Tigriopus californicus TaxID=6832 RepID=A0A553PA51_TIGCA|nr:uncharacterized protein LOC131892941 [Tigriopus californicus]TRY74546.1 hypothetical protein TCAL_01340 [Tigriopus californicus]